MRKGHNSLISFSSQDIIVRHLMVMKSLRIFEQDQGIEPLFFASRVANSRPHGPIYFVLYATQIICLQGWTLTNTLQRNLTKVVPNPVAPLFSIRFCRGCSSTCAGKLAGSAKRMMAWSSAPPVFEILCDRNYYRTKRAKAIANTA